VPDWLTDFLTWLVELLLWIPRQIYKLVLEALANVINSIPVPDFILNLPANVAATFSAIGWWGELAMVPEGVTMVLVAYALRFLVRRIPVIG
jgi:hypothetical protein